MPEPKYDKNGRLTYESMREIVSSGETVLYYHGEATDPVPLSTLAHLPTKAQVMSAQGSKEEVQETQVDLSAQIAQLQGQLALLQGSAPPKAEPPPAPKKSNEPGV